MEDEAKRRALSKCHRASSSKLVGGGVQRVKEVEDKAERSAAEAHRHMNSLSAKLPKPLARSQANSLI